MRVHEVPEVERLKLEIETLDETIRTMARELRDVTAERDDATARLVAAVKALEPFEGLAMYLTEDGPLHIEYGAPQEFTVADLRRAAEIVKRETSND